MNLPKYPFTLDKNQNYLGTSGTFNLVLFGTSYFITVGLEIWMAVKNTNRTKTSRYAYVVQSRNQFSTSFGNCKVYDSRLHKQKFHQFFPYLTSKTKWWRWKRGCAVDFDGTVCQVDASR